MHYYNLYSRNGKIDENGIFSIESAWEVVFEVPPVSQQKLQQQLVLWAGTVGDQLRLPPIDSNADYAFDPDTVVDTIELKLKDSASGLVIYHAHAIAGVPQAIGAVKEETDSAGVLRRRGAWRVADSALKFYLPNVGDTLNWNGGIFVCEHCICEHSIPPETQFTLVGREVTTKMIGSVTYTANADGEENADSVYFVSDSKREEFLAAHPVNSACPWAGSDYYLQSVEVRPYGVLGSEITLKARKIRTRMIAENRSEEFVGLTLSGAIQRRILWTSRWFVKAEDINSFYSQTGLSPSNWAESNTVITEIRPVRRSALEYELTMEAQHRGNPGLFDQEQSDNTSLSNRTDIAVDMGDFFVSSEMAGYLAENGNWTENPEWDPEESCPFTTNRPLAVNLVNAITRTLFITESTYHSGRASGQLGAMSNWAESRVFSGSVGGKSGSYLKIRQTSTEVRDRAGNVYTRINRTYQKSPGNFSWNSGYWNNH